MGHGFNLEGSLEDRLRFLIEEGNTIKEKYGITLTYLFISEVGNDVINEITTRKEAEDALLKFCPPENQRYVSRWFIENFPDNNLYQCINVNEFLTKAYKENGRYLQSDRK